MSARNKDVSGIPPGGRKEIGHMPGCVHTVKDNISPASRYGIIAAGNAVYAGADARLQFECKGWQRDFKASLRSAIAGLPRFEGGTLLAEYGSAAEDGFSDVENVLFYNVGGGAFDGIFPGRLSFRRLPPEEAKERLLHLPAGGRDFSHFYSYQVLPTISLPGIRGKAAACWADIALNRPSSSLKPLDYWRLMKAHSGRIAVCADAGALGPFGIDIVFTAPAQDRVKLTAVIKPLLDGIVCAFHRYENPWTPDFYSMCELLDCGHELLLNQSQGILGPQRYVTRSAGGRISWNPQDHRCGQAALTIQYGKTDGWSFSGTVYDLNQA